jgi:short-subunit dehydrogenase
MEDVWLITGCSRGLGRELAKLALKSGKNVIVTARNINDVSDLITEYPDTATALPLDVTKTNDIRQVIKKIRQKFEKVDVLINNAGIRYFGALEESDEKQIRHMFDINFFGLANVTKAVLPLMRKQRSGHIVNISSIAGLIGFAGMGFYNATKFAVEGYSEALARELQSLGIKVTIVAPGGFKTGWESYPVNISKRNITDYEDTAGLMKRRVSENAGWQPGDPIRAAKAIIMAIEAKNPPLHLLLGTTAVLETREKMESLKNDIETWKIVSFESDYH